MRVEEYYSSRDSEMIKGYNLMVNNGMNHPNRSRDPSRAEIKARCKEIQKTWSEEEKQLRMVSELNCTLPIIIEPVDLLPFMILYEKE